LKYGSQTAPVTITAVQTDTTAHLIVHNEGNPIPPHEQAVIFNKFQRTAPLKTATGWGLGLAFVKGMAEAHYGSVRVESSAEKGTDFIVELPKKYSSALLRAIAANAVQSGQLAQ